MSDDSSFSQLAEDARQQRPEIALILGSGLSEVAHRLRHTQRVPFLEVPGLETTSVPGHRGCLTLGSWRHRRVLVFEGRLHAYEGHPWRRVLMPGYVARELGARVLLVTNAAGGIHDTLLPGSLMVLKDHIDWTRQYCWRYPGPGGIGTSRPSPYSPRLARALSEAAAKVDVPLQPGVYAQVTGPCYETPAEIRALRTCGADAVGMSTAREVQAGFDLGLECAGLSLITNRAAGLCDGPLHHDEVLITAQARKDCLADLLEEVVVRP
jgi:purine-nucleoside phosphorylase